MLQVDSGLTNIVVTDTSITRISGNTGVLAYRGYPVGQLAKSHTYEAVAAQLWRTTPADVRSRLAAGRVAAWKALPGLGQALEHEDGMSALRAGLAQLDDSVDAVGACAVLVSAWSQRRLGRDPVAPNPENGHATDYLRMLRRPTNAPAVRALESYLIAVMDHGLNASTFAARVVTSTGSDELSAIVAAVGALKGPLHGGAPGPVLDMLDAIEASGDAQSWLTHQLALGHRIMGMGHRVYRVRDPRAAVLESALKGLPRCPRLALAHEVERTATALLGERHPNRALRANVEFYTAVILEALGLPRALFAPTFAVARVAGWRAHIDEQRETGKLIRPTARYCDPIGTATPHCVVGAATQMPHPSKSDSIS